MAEGKGRLAILNVRLHIAAVAGLAISCGYAPASDSLQVRLAATIPAGKKPVALALTPDESELFVADSADESLRMVRTATNQVTRSIPLGCDPLAIAVPADGATVLVGCTTGLRIISVRTGSVTPLSTGSVRDLAVTSDSRTAFLAEQTSGLWKLDLGSRQLSTVDPSPIAMNLALAPDGKYLYVNYQRSGPGGRPGHDAIGKFDTKTGKRVSSITGLANVGDAIAVSPDGRRLWADGEDACESRAYDHLGCPAVPAGIINVIDTATDHLVYSIPLVGDSGPILLRFSPDRAYVVVNTGGPRFIDARTFTTVAVLPGLRMTAIVLLRDGRRAYVALTMQGIAVLDIICH